MVPGALQSKVVSPFSDLLINIAPQWAWHGNWVHHGYDEAAVLVRLRAISMVMSLLWV